jgi:hypothetical protein
LSASLAMRTSASNNHCVAFVDAAALSCVVPDADAVAQRVFSQASLRHRHVAPALGRRGEPTSNRVHLRFSH